MIWLKFGQETATKVKISRISCWMNISHLLRITLTDWVDEKEGNMCSFSSIKLSPDESFYSNRHWIIETLYDGLMNF